MDLSITPYNESLKFPQLAPRYQGMPRRYEETKPVVIQDFTHRRIIGMGHDIQKKLLERLEVEKHEAIEWAEKTTWEKAEKKKHSAIKKVREELDKRLEKALEQQQKEYEQIIKEEILRVEMAMQKQALEQVQAEKARGEAVLKETVQAVEERCAKELEDAVARARREEQGDAYRQMEELELKHSKKTEVLIKTQVVEAAEKLALMETRKDRERLKAVAITREEERLEREKMKEELTRLHEIDVEIERGKVQQKVRELLDCRRQMRELEVEKKRLASYLDKTRTAFQDFINRVQKVKKGQADFMLPPAYIEEIEKGLVDAMA